MFAPPATACATTAASPTTLDLIERIRDYRVVLVGDAIIDEYQYVMPMGKPPKESIIATRYQDREMFAGGVFAAANHVASFCAQVDVITCLGAPDSHEDLIRRSLRPNVELHLRAASRSADDAQAPLRRSVLHAQAVRGLRHGRRSADGRPAGAISIGLDPRALRRPPMSSSPTDFGHGLIGASTVGALASSTRRSSP